MLINIAPSNPVKTAVTAVAVTLQLAARAIVRVCSSMISPKSFYLVWANQIK